MNIGADAFPVALRMIWASPCSLLGLILGLPFLIGGGAARRVGRSIEIALCAAEGPHNGLAQRLPFAAITFGHVILGTNAAELVRLRAHERVHVRQYECWGPLFLLAYPASSLIALLRGRCPYRDNRFEIEAFREGAAAQDRA